MNWPSNFGCRKDLSPPCVSKNTEGMFQCIVDWLRHVLRCLVKAKISICPQSVTWMPRKCLYLSQTYPYGKWHGGRTYFGSEHMFQLATFISNLPNHGSNAAAWKVAISSLPWMIIWHSGASRHAALSEILSIQFQFQGPILTFTNSTVTGSWSSLQMLRYSRNYFHLYTPSRNSQWQMSRFRLGFPILKILHTPGGDDCILGGG